jgi:hypothetical protein
MQPGAAAGRSAAPGSTRCFSAIMYLATFALFFPQSEHLVGKAHRLVIETARSDSNLIATFSPHDLRFRLVDATISASPSSRNAQDNSARASLAAERRSVSRWASQRSVWYAGISAALDAHPEKRGTPVARQHNSPIGIQHLRGDFHRQPLLQVARSLQSEDEAIAPERSEWAKCDERGAQRKQAVDLWCIYDGKVTPITRSGDYSLKLQL